MKICFSEPLGYRKAILWEKYIAIQAYLKKQEVSNTQPNPTPKGAGKGIANIAWSLQKKGKNKDESRNKQYRNKKTLEWNNETKSWFFIKWSFSSFSFFIKLRAGSLIKWIKPYPALGTRKEKRPK